MALRLNEIHPSIVHYPIALLPVAIGADLLARLTGSQRLADAGRVLMPIAAASTVISAAAGLLAQQEVKAEGKAADLLITHRSLNISLTTLATAMAAWRLGKREVGAGYLALGAVGLGAMGYSAYLGGKMVYEHGIGVKPADGLRTGDSPELAPGHFGEAARRSVADVQQAIQTVVDDTRAGRIAPSLGKDVENPAARPPAGGTRANGGPSDDLLADRGPGSIESMP